MVDLSDNKSIIMMMEDMSHVMVDLSVKKNNYYRTAG